MPGLAGIIAAPESTDFGKDLDLMADAMMHEKTFRNRKVRLPEAGVWLAWTGPEGAFGDCSPVWNERRDILLAFAGEEFAAGTDTAAGLLRLYEEQGESFLAKLSGVFAGVIVDRRQNRVLLFNDRHGLARLYHHDDGRAFCFSSEAKALLRIRPSLRQLDLQGLAEQFGCGAPQEQRSLFAGIATLPPASCFTLAPGVPARRDTYFRIEDWASQEPLAPAEFRRELAAALSAVVPRYFGGRPRAALALDGGLDSRLIASWSPHAPFFVPSYTFGGMHRQSRDVRIATEVARRWQQYHQVVALDKGFFADFPGLAKRTITFGEGAQDLSATADLYLGRFAKPVGAARVAGDFGAQILRTRRALPRSAPVDGFASDFAIQIRKAAHTFAQSPSEPALSTILRRDVPAAFASRYTVARTQTAVRLPFLDDAIVRLQFRCPATLRRSCSLALALVAAGDPALASLATDRGLTGPRRLWNLPREWCASAWRRLDAGFDEGMPQWLARRDGRIGQWEPGKRFAGRNEYQHFRRWYRHELAGYVKEILLDARTLGREHLDRVAVERMVAAHTGGTANHTREIHLLLTYELLHRQFIDQPKAPEAPVPARV